MANKYYSEFSDRKITAPMPPKDKRETGKIPYPERTRAWVTDIGPVGPSRNTVGFPEVKQSAKQHMADDKGLRVGKKISKLRHEGKPEDVAVATALNMEREGRLTELGGYRRKKKY